MRGRTGLAIIGGVLALVSGVEILAHGPLAKLDIRVAAAFWPVTQTTSTHIGTFLFHVGTPWIACVVVGVLAAAVSALTRRPASAIAAAVALGTVGASTWALKQVFPHPSILGAPGSFPSGHTGVAVVASGIVVWLLLPERAWRENAALAAAAFWGAVMAWGRLVLESHWLSDVIAGWGIGIVALVLALRTADSQLGTRGWARSAPVDR